MLRIKKLVFLSALKSKKAENVLSAEPLLQELLHLYVYLCMCVDEKEASCFEDKSICFIQTKIV